jgi:DNA-binding transcriptional MerR regulator
VDKQDGLMSVGKAAKKAGVSRQSLQYYLMIDLLKPVEITETGRRLFDQSSIDRIKLIKRLNKSGYPLRAIRRLFLEGRENLKGTEE